MGTTIRYVFLTAIRDLLFIGLFIAMLIAIGISSFLGDTALVEAEQTKAVYIGGTTRLIVIIGLITFVCFHVRRAFDNREVEVMISRPISRTSFVLAYWLGFAFVSLLLIIGLTFLLSLTTLAPLDGLLYWSASLFAESLLVIAFALFASLILRSAVTSVILGFTFYILSRLMGFFLFILDAPHLFSKSVLGQTTRYLLEVVSILLPRIDLFAKTELLVYGFAGLNTALYVDFAQSLIYVPILLAAAVFDFKRRQF